ncbi:MAG: hypothetical protein EXR52_03100 [Dehalococcoidia bacterium]|nr:hypothetical protein [Dehalococcoidia bacterium]
MPQLVLTSGESILMRAALKRRLAELGRPGLTPEPSVTEIERITRLLQQIAGTPMPADVRVMASSDETALMAQSLHRSAAWQRSMLPHARDHGVMATLCRKVESLTVHEPTLPERLARHVTGMLHRGESHPLPHDHTP